MPKYLYSINYSPEGMKGVMAEGATARLEAATKVAAALGATVESFYFGLGDVDAYLIVDAPDTISAAAASVLTGATGAVSIHTTQLLTPEEGDALAAKAREAAASYRKPGE